MKMKMKMPPEKMLTMMNCVLMHFWCSQEVMVVMSLQHEIQQQMCTQCPCSMHAVHRFSHTDICEYLGIICCVTWEPTEHSAALYSRFQPHRTSAHYSPMTNTCWQGFVQWCHTAYQLCLLIVSFLCTLLYAVGYFAAELRHDLYKGPLHFLPIAPIVLSVIVNLGFMYITFAMHSRVVGMPLVQLMKPS